MLLTGMRFAVAVFCVLVWGGAKARVRLPPNTTVPAVIVFGDSIVDAGNNNNLKTMAKCNFPPYGKDFMGGVPTGRFCNGKVPSDFIAEELGITRTIPAYLDPDLKSHDLLTGVTFASGGTGFDPLTPKLASALSLPQQLDLFREYIGKLKGLVGENRTSFILANSFFLVLCGSDDIINTYFLSGTRKQYDFPSYTDIMLDGASSLIKELYGLGARRIAFCSVPPLGCVPSQRTLAGGIQRMCVERYNQAAQLFNSKLSSQLASLSKTLPAVKLVLVDIYTPLLDIIQNPNKYGFEVANKGCCGTGNIEVTFLCNPLVPTCPDDSKYVFWDSYHPTERAYRILISEIIAKYITDFI